MNEELSALLQVYQGRINQLTAQNIAFEAKISVLTKQLEAKQSQIDGGDIQETPPSEGRTNN